MVEQVQNADISARFSELEPLSVEQQQLLAPLIADLPQDAAVYVVGGAVRDAYLGQTALDLDVVCAHIDPLELAERSGLPFTFHPHYRNATLQLSPHRHLDLIRARDEYYPAPAAKPMVQAGSIAQDLARRDYSINAMAWQIWPENRLLDPHQGLADVQQRILRVLHPRSFIDDPSRIVRGARLAARLGFQLSADSASYIPEALAYRLDATARLRSELHLILKEPAPGLVFATLAQWGAASLYAHPRHPERVADVAMLQRADAYVQQAATGRYVTIPDLHVMLWLQSMAADVATCQYWHIAKRMLQPKEGWSRTVIAALQAGLAIPECVPELASLQIRGTDALDLGIRGTAIGEGLRYVANLQAQGEVEGYTAQREALAQWWQRQQSVLP